MFMDPCIVSIFQYISNKMLRYTVYLHLETALHFSGGTSTHHQSTIQTLNKCPNDYDKFQMAYSLKQNSLHYCIK